METTAVVLEAPGKLALKTVEISPPGDDDVVVDIEWSGISTGTERLLWAGRMPAFPGMGYPLVPGYESVGRIREAGPNSGQVEGTRDGQSRPGGEVRTHADCRCREADGAIEGVGGGKDNRPGVGCQSGHQRANSAVAETLESAQGKIGRAHV